MTDSEGATEVAPPRRKGCGCWTIVLVTLLGATLFVVGVYIFWRWSNARGVERMIAIAKEKGEPTTPEELSASFPTSPGIERTTRLWLRAMEVGDRAELKDHVNAAIVGYGEPGDVEMRIDMDRFNEERVMSPRILEASKAYLAPRAEAVEVAHEARRSGIVARFPLEHEVDENDYFEVMQRHRHLANVLSLELEVRRREGRTEGTGEILLTLLALAESVRNHPGQLFQFVRFSVQGVAREQLIVALERGDLTDEEVDALQQAWSDADLVPALRLMLLELQEDALHSLISPPFPYFAEDRRPCPEEDAYYAAKIVRRTLDLSHSLDDAEAEGTIAAAEFDRVLQSPFGQRRFAGSIGFVGAVSLYPATLRRYQTWNDATVVLLACARFRRSTGDWPESVDQLVPAYLDQIPPDRYDGGSLKYRRTDEGVAVYSVGEDETDDGGVIKESYLEEPFDFGVRVRTPSTPSAGVGEK